MSTITPAMLVDVLDATSGILITTDDGHIYAGTSLGSSTMTFLQDAAKRKAHTVVMSCDAVRQWIADADGDLTVAAEALAAAHAA